MIPRITLLPLLGLILTACSPAPEDAPASLAPQAEPALAARSNALCQATHRLQQQVVAFLDAPTEASLANARQTWQAAHQAYRLVQSDYALAGLTPPQIADSRDPIDAFPLLPGYLDQVPGYPNSGVVFSDVPLTPEFLAREHQSTDFHYAILGFHPLEFMLWGNPGENAADQVNKFLGGPPKPEAEAIDVSGRRKDLIRLMAHSLDQQSKRLCEDEEQRRLTAVLASSPTPTPLTLETDAGAVAHQTP
ncbi:imelysin family protein [Marinobacter sp. SS21]|uniref:imelysin family protein n=1 Tax=Marinobacter sp. SS21 TaxID=2979460 RepID=UPI00232C9ECC|nr:imelysin family protein [Marinobacter sp. SS21]MDC0663084.1 imelysin family protein [Marinobacter sp. SS21]